MTSQASSKNKSVFHASFRAALRSGSINAAIFTVALLILLPLSTLVRLLGERQSVTLKDAYVFVLGSEGGALSLVLVGQTVLFSLLMGVVLFRFMLSVRASNVYASLGIKRSALFLSRYFAGLLLLSVSIILPFLLSGLVSGVLVGFHRILFWSLLYNIVSYLSLAAICFSLFACVACGVGTAIESLGFTLLLLCTPSILFGGLSLCGAALLYGCPYSLPTYTDSSGLTVVTGGLLGTLTNFNPLTFAYSGSSSYMAAYKDIDGQPKLAELFGASAQNWTRPDFAPALLWLLVAALIAAIAVHAYRHRKMEIAGFLGTNKVLNRLAAFIVGCGAYMLVFLVFQSNTIGAMFAGSLAMLIACFLVLLLLIRSAKDVCRQLHLMILQLVCVTAVFLVLISGGFGYDTRLPETDTIAYAEMTSVVSNTAPAESGNSSVIPYGFNTAYGFSLEPVLFGKYTTARDIDEVRSIHSKFIQLGSAKLEDDHYLNACVLIKYTLKNGQTVLRYYDRADVAALNQCLNLTESDLFREQLQTAFTSDKINSLDYELGEVIAVNTALDDDSFHRLTLTEEQHTALKAALQEDLSKQTKQQRFFPETPAVGVLWFRLKDIDLVSTEPETLRMNYNPANAATEPVFYLTEDMTNTLAFLGGNGLMSLFDAHETEQIKSISFYPAKIDRSSINYEENTAFTPDAHAVILNDTSVAYLGVEDVSPANPVTDRTRIAELLPKLQMHYFTQDSGYYCCIDYADGSQVRKYLPEADAPDYVRYYNY